ncbi:MAG TPA: hypothetical protein VLI39_01975 [Sedimentisphaerales bacterium]|nr:hypothetical protein [Sedimentisphaerales bacterium]
MAQNAQRQHEHIEEELEDLRKELESFQKEKERVRAIIGKIGGVPKTRANLINALFIIVVATSVIVSFAGGKDWQLLMIEIATVTLAIKIIYLIHTQMRIAHFEFWILSSLEWRTNEITKELREIRKQIEDKGCRFHFTYRVTHSGEADCRYPRIPSTIRI